MHWCVLRRLRKSIGLYIQRVSCNSSRTLADHSIPDLASIPLERIRNFCIIAHVDHGKSTLSDRLLEFTGTVPANSGINQILDTLQVERERGITVKAQTASLLYEFQGHDYLLNLIDTPGHVDFSTEVSRSLAACEGVVLVVDANDGVQAQTVANFFLAFSKDMPVVPVLNKTDLKNANPARVADQLKTMFDIERKDVLKISAKYGIGIRDVLDAIVQRIPCPTGDRNKHFRAVLIDSTYDQFRGALSLISIKDGALKVGDSITSCHTKKIYEVKSLAVLRPNHVSVKKLTAGQIGVLGCQMRDSKETIIGDTIHITGQPVEPQPGFQLARPMVFAGLYPVDALDSQNLKKALDELLLNDSSVTIDLEKSLALGQGWRLGFLGLLHLEVFQQRLETEWKVPCLLTAPSVTYKFCLKPTKKTAKRNTNEVYVNNPAMFPHPSQVEQGFEPAVLGTIITPEKYLGPVMNLCLERRGVQQTSQMLDDRLMLQFEMPLAEIVMDFHDALKSLTSGYASFDYEDCGYWPADLMKLDICLNGTLVPEFSFIVNKIFAYERAHALARKLKEFIPRQQMLIAIQCKHNDKVLARENIRAYRKDVLWKCHGGNDASRKMKLLRAQAEGKKRMRLIAKVNVPTEVFINVMKK